VQSLQQALTFASSRAAAYARALAAVLRIVCTDRGWACAEAWLASRDESILKPGPVWPRDRSAFRGFFDHSRTLGYRRGSDLPGRVLQSRKPEWVEDVSSAPRGVYGRGDQACEAGLRAALAIPVLTGGEVLAVLVFYAAEDQKEDGEYVDFIGSVLSPLGPSLERKKIEEELRIRARQQEAVASLGVEALEQSTEIDRLLHGAILLFTKILDLEYGELLELVPDTGRFYLRAYLASPDDSASPMQVPDGVDSHAGRALFRSEPVAVEDFSKESRFATPERLRERHIESGVCVVIHGHTRPIGVLGAYTTRRRRFTENDTSFLQGVANVLGTALERTRAEKELERHRRELERLVAERTARLEASHDQLRQSERLASMGTLAAGLGHDMKNVLLPVLCRLDALEGGLLSRSARGEVRAVRRSLEEEVGPLLEAALPKEVNFHADLPADLPRIRVPRHRLTQAVLNLLVNAGEATEGHGKVRLWGTVKSGSWVRLGVSDDGRGMSQNVRRHALEPFFTTRSRGLSTGLGLSLVHGVAKGAGGTVKIESSPGRGTTVVLTLPAIEEPNRLQETPRRVASVSLKDRRISAYVSTLLRSAGFGVRHAPPDVRPDSILWVTTAGATRRESVIRYLEEDYDRRVILVGQSGPAKPQHRIVQIQDPGDLEALHQSLRATVQEIQEISDAV
ncbi:MAG: GAF domain-containing protein, partial [Planctomycetota bacterium]|jgi:signal transduction histidine kinase